MRPALGQAPPAKLLRCSSPLLALLRLIAAGQAGAAGVRLLARSVA
ncbi:MAG TPA: hypothetical protein VF605_07085 [Allosphingosinicella sp.]